MPRIFGGGNRLFLFLPPNLHFISSSASSLSFSEALSPKCPLTNTLSFFPPVPQPRSLSLTTRLSTQHHCRRHALTSLLTPTHCSHFLILFLVFVLSLPRSELSFFFFFLYMQSGPVIVVLLTHTDVCLWMEGAFTLLCYRALRYTANVWDVRDVHKTGKNVHATLNITHRDNVLNLHLRQLTSLEA